MKVHRRPNQLPKTALNGFSAEVIAAACRCLTGAAPTTTTTETVTVTATVATVTSADPTAPAATITAVGPTTFLHIASLDDYCFPRQVIGQPHGVPATDSARPATFEYAFQQCAAECLANPACGELYVNYPDPIDPRYGANCYIGAYPGRADPSLPYTGTWGGDSDFNCGNQVFYKFGEWYNRPDQ